MDSRACVPAAADASSSASGFLTDTPARAVHRTGSAASFPMVRRLISTFMSVPRHRRDRHRAAAACFVVALTSRSALRPLHASTRWPYASVRGRYPSSRLHCRPDVSRVRPDICGARRGARLGNARRGGPGTRRRDPRELLQRRATVEHDRATARRFGDLVRTSGAPSSMGCGSSGMTRGPLQHGSPTVWS